MRGYIPPVNAEEKLICKKAEDLHKLSMARQANGFSSFLDERGICLATAQLNKNNATYFSFGGFEKAERKVICVYDNIYNKPTDNDFPISCVLIFCKGADKLTHRDFLGAIMAIGIKRECIGDIVVVNESTAKVYILTKVKNIIIDTLIEVGRYKTNISEIDIFDNFADLHKNINLSEKTISVASLRLDVVLSGILNIGRTKATDIIKSNLCQVCHIPIDNVHFTLQQDDTLSIKGYGKYTITQIGDLTRKGRIIINYKYFN